MLWIFARAGHHNRRHRPAAPDPISSLIRSACNPTQQRLQIGFPRFRFGQANDDDNNNANKLKIFLAQLIIGIGNRLLGLVWVWGPISDGIDRRASDL